LFQPHERKCHTNRHLARRERLSHGTSTTGGSRAGLFMAHSRAAYLYWYLETAASGWQFTRAAGAESNRLHDAPSRVTTQIVRPDDLREAHVSLQRSAWAPPHRRRRWDATATDVFGERLRQRLDRTLMLPSVWRNARRGCEDHPSNQSRAV